VVEVPGMGDDIQTAKAGILEIADILVVNKADHPGADNTEKSLRAMLEMAYAEPPASYDHLVGQLEFPKREDDNLWIPPVIQTIATLGDKIEGLVEHIQEHRDYLERSGGWKCREKARFLSELDMLVKDALAGSWRKQLPDEIYDEVLDKLCDRKISPYQAVRYLLDKSGFKTANT
jgi:LAO/AO transport system kinase